MKWVSRILFNKEHEQAQQELNILEEEVAAARNFFRRNRKSYFQGKKRISLYLILGPSRFGKTTILSQAGLDLIDVNKQTFGKVNPTKYCSFWFTKDAIYIDTAGNYTKPDITKPRNDLIWRGFIKLLQKYFGKDSINGTLVILDLPAISQDKNLLQEALFCIQERIYEMATLVKSLPLHIIFTKCDQISGFSEFFALLSPSERLQPFGISFDNKRDDLIAVFTAKFTALLRHLNNRLVDNLQKSITLQDRRLNKLFPVQLDSLRQTFIDVVSKIPHSRQISLSGIYFTSSIQDGAPVNPLRNIFSHILNLKEKNSYSLMASDNNSYFVEEIFSKVIKPKKTKKKSFWGLLRFPIKCFWLSIAMVLALSLVIVVSKQSYWRNVLLFEEARDSLQTQDIYDYNNLHKIISRLEDGSKSWWLTLGINKVGSLTKSLIKAHQVLFSQSLIKQLEDRLDKMLGSQSLVDLLDLYRGFQVYLMFGDNQKLKPLAIKTWFNDYWIKVYDQDKKDSLQQQLITSLKYRFETKLNQQLISIVRDKLNGLSLVKLLYLLLANEFMGQDIVLGGQKSISRMYVKENFHRVYKDFIPTLVDDIPKHDWVLGDLKKTSKVKAKKISSDLRKFYIKEYIAVWKNIFKPTAQVEIKDLQEVSQYIRRTSSITADFLQKAQYHLDINNPPAGLTREINAKFSGLNDVDVVALQKRFVRLARYVEGIAGSADHQQRAFLAVKEYFQGGKEKGPIKDFQEFINKQPGWLQKYLQAVLANVWQVLLDVTYERINQAWNQTVIPKYREVLFNKYPFFKGSKEEVSLDGFSKFFGPHGLMDGFFDQYLKVLVNTKKSSWTWRKLNGKAIDFSPKFLEVFLRANLIRKMFFAEGGLKPKLRFSLKPVAMTANVQSFVMHLDGQKVVFTNKDKKTSRLSWPGPKSGLVTLSFIDNQGKYFTMSEFGIWAWFRVLDKMSIKGKNNTRNFELTFNLDGNAAKYRLSTTRSVNPFIPKVINNFRCEEQI